MFSFSLLSKRFSPESPFDPFSSSKNESDVKQSTQIMPSFVHLDRYPTESVPFPSVNIKKGIQPLGSISLPEVFQTEKSDLVKNVYEGGLKLWECAIDLVQYFETLGQKQALDFSNLRVLELGCGLGVPGLYCLAKGASVMFQDFNEEVLLSCTIPNVFANQGNYDRSAFYSGDWASFTALLDQSQPLSEDLRFDIILASETVYDEANYHCFLSCVDRLLKRSPCQPWHGAYLSNKRYYFGVGGGTLSFAQFVSEAGAAAVSEAGPLLTETVSEVEDGVSNVRDILLIHR